MVKGGETMTELMEDKLRAEMRGMEVGGQKRFRMDDETLEDQKDLSLICIKLLSPERAFSITQEIKDGYNHLHVKCYKTPR